MRAVSVDFKEIVGAAPARAWTVRRTLLLCGVAAALAYAAANIAGPLAWKGYSVTSQTISELFAIDAPSTPVVVPILMVYTVLVYAFGAGVWLSAGSRRALRAAAVLIVAKEVFGLIATVVTPLHMRGVETTISDTLHGVFSLIGVFCCMLPAMVVAAAAFGKRFRLYTIATIVVFVACGIWSFMAVPEIGENMPTPWLGVQERINAYSYVLWCTVLAMALLRREPGRPASGGQKKA